MQGEGRTVLVTPLPLTLFSVRSGGGDEELRDMDSSHPFPSGPDKGCTDAGKAEPGLSVSGGCLVAIRWKGLIPRGNDE